MKRLDVGIAAQNVVRRDGQGRVILQIADLLVRLGHSVTIYSLRLDESLTNRVEWVRIPAPRGPGLLVDLVFSRGVTRRLNAASHDVVCFLGPSGACDIPNIYYAAFAHSGLVKIPELHSSLGPYRRLHNAVGRAMEKRAVARADGLCAMSSGVASDLAPFLRKGKPTWVVPGGVDANEFAPADGEARLKARQELGIAPAQLVISFVGEFVTPRKGLNLLLRAIGPEQALIIHGSGDLETVMATARDLGIADRIYVFDHTVHVSRSMTASDVVAVPSLYEPFSLVALEAVSTAIPVVISDRAGAASLIGEAAAGIVVEPDVGALREAFEQLTDPLERERLGRNGRKLAEEMSWDAVSELAVQALSGISR